MGTGYTRNDTSNNIADGNVIDAADLDGEFDSIQAAFNASTGHTHDGTSAEGAPITVTGPAQEYVSTGTELRAKTTNTYDLGSSSVQWKDLYVDGTGYIDTLSADAATVNGNITVTGTVDGRDVAADGTKLDGIEASADVTDTANVTAAGALMDSELTDITAVKALNQGVATTDSPTFAGLTTTGNVSFGDADILNFGASNDLQIFHDGSDSFINETGTGDLKIQAAAQIKLGSPTNEFYATFNENSSVVLYYDNAAKLATTSSGVSVTGNVAVTGTVDGRDVATDGSKLDGIEAGADVTDTTNVTAAGALMDSEIADLTAVKAINQGLATTNAPTFAGLTLTTHLDMGDNDQIRLGDSDDLLIYHDGSNSYVTDAGTGVLLLQGSNGIYLTNYGNTETYLGCNLNGTVDLRYDNSVKLATTSAGITVTGSVTADDLIMGDGDRIKLGNSEDLQLYHDGSNSYVVDNGTGDLLLRGSNSVRLQDTGTGNNMVLADRTGPVSLFYSGSEKLATTSTGINVTGTITADGLDMEDNQKILLGASDDLQIYHNGSASFIDDVGTGSLNIRATDHIISDPVGNNKIIATTGAEVSLWYNASKKIETTSYGVSVTGSAVASTFTGSISGTALLDYNAYQNFVITMTGNITLSNPSTEKVGQSGFIVLIHSGAARTVSLGTDYETAGGAGLTLSATAGATDIVPYIVAASGRILLGTPQLAFS